MRLRLRKQEGFTLSEWVVVGLLGGILSAAVIAVLFSLTGVFHSQGTRMLNQDSARTAINQVGRYIRMATSSADNLTTQSNSIATALPHDLEFYVDLDGDGLAEKARYYVEGDTLKMQTADPQWVTSPAPGWTYGDYETDGIIIQAGVRNGADPVFRYYKLRTGSTTTSVGSSPLVEFEPTTAADRQLIVSIGISLVVNERTDLAKGDVHLATAVEIRQRDVRGLE